MVEHDEPDPSSYLTPIAHHVDRLGESLRTVSLAIHDNPELQYKEFHAHRVITEFLAAQHGWHVTPSAYAIPTAFVAVFDSGRPGPVVSFNVEYDALKGIGHACGHNLIAIASLGAALATAEVMQQFTLDGKVVIFGTPAEEGGGGKIKLLDAGAYKDHDVDISLISHPGISPDSALCVFACVS
jgi:metal-dependent amidase/aminoacylase/carboxypeptidase family protein